MATSHRLLTPSGSATPRLSGARHLRPGRTRALLGAAALVPALAACAPTQTNAVYQPAQGTNEQSSRVDVLNAVVVASEAGTGRLVTTFVNQQSRPDSVVGIAGAGADSRLRVGLGSPLDLKAQPDGLVSLSAADAPQILVKGSAVKPGRLVSLRMTFSRAQSVTMRVPVVAPYPPYEDLAPSGEPQTETLPPTPSPTPDSADSEG